MILGGTNNVLHSSVKKHSCGLCALAKKICNSINHSRFQTILFLVTMINLFVNKYELEGITFPSKKDDWKKFEKNNITITLNVLYAKKEKVSCLCFKT